MVQTIPSGCQTFVHQGALLVRYKTKTKTNTLTTQKKKFFLVIITLLLAIKRRPEIKRMGHHFIQIQSSRVYHSRTFLTTQKHYVAGIEIY